VIATFGSLLEEGHPAEFGTPDNERIVEESHLDTIGVFDHVLIRNHIAVLVDNEAQAKDLIAKIKAGASFEDLAKQYSKDPGSGKNGGDLDWSSPQAYVPEFGAAAEKLKKGEMTDTPVKTQFGWHIIRLDDIRDVAPPPLEQVKDQIAKQIQQEKLQAFEEGLQKKAVIK